MYFSTYNATTPSSYMTTDPSMYRWQHPNNSANKLSSHATTLPTLLSTPSSAELPGQKNSNLSLSDRLAYVEALVDMNAMVIEAIWPTAATSNNGSSGTSIVPLRCFIQEVLKRSRTTYSTLQTAFFYLFRARPAIVHYLQTSSATRQDGSSQKNTTPLSGRDAYIHCGRRMFLASLVVASKFVQDKTYRNSVWAKIAGLTVQEINASERVFLGLLDYRLYVAQPTFDQWHQLLHTHVQAKTSSQKYSISSGSYTDSNINNSNKSLFQSSSADLPAFITTSASSPQQKSPYPISRSSSSSSSLPSPINSTNDASLPPLRPPFCVLPTSSSSSTPSSSIPALSPSSIASTSSSTCSPILHNNPLPLNITTATGGKRRLLNDHDITPYLHYRSSTTPQQQRKRPCNVWPPSSSCSSSSNSC